VRVIVFGLGRIGCATAAWLARRGHRVVGFDDAPAVEALPEALALEDGLAGAVAEGRAAGRLSFTSEAAAALGGAEALWVALEMPLGADGGPDADRIRARLDAVAGGLAPGTCVLVATPVPVGFTRALAAGWRGRGLRVACAPENLRLGAALAGLDDPAPLTVGIAETGDRDAFAALLAPGGRELDFVSPESAEMAKHARNAFLAGSVAFANEIARLAAAAGADVDAVERALRRDPRVGAAAYVRAGAPFSGGTLARDVRALAGDAARGSIEAPLLRAVLESNDVHERWLRARMAALLDLGGGARPVAAVLGLGYKPAAGAAGGSSAAALCAWLRDRQVGVRAHDPGSGGARPPEGVTVCATALDALQGADLAVVATEWPEYRALTADVFVSTMRRPRVVDAGGFLAALAGDTRLEYVSPGRRAGA
jgi:UDPglucose 6-dehydrogenase